MAVCPDCSGTGAFSYPCKKCGGTGMFNSPKTGKQIGKCRLCGGTGRFYPRFKEDKDRPLKTFRFPYVLHKLPNGEEILAYRCRKCRGSGELRDRLGTSKRRKAG